MPSKVVQAKRREMPNLSVHVVIPEAKRRVDIPQPGAKQQDQQDA